MPKTFYITTAISYVNSKPHMGHAMEAVEADSLARYHRLIGDETYFLTGTDEHGSKIYKLAQERGVTPIEICDENALKFQNLKKILNLSNDDFIRTSDQKRHYPAVQKLWQKLVEQGDIYKDKYEGLYCSGCEAFLNEKDLVDGKCPNHNAEPEKLTEENYFFRLSKYTDQILELLENDKYEIVPNLRKKEILNVVKEGLRDVSFSRPKNVLPWGIPVPGDDEQVMYVWCDALTNYISALGYADEGELYKKFWEAGDEVVHVIGKDIVRFHVAIWPAMLLAAGVRIPRKAMIHGFITSDGQKMSKSLGNVVDPVEVAEKYGTDPLRYYILKEIPVGKDGDFTFERFDELYNADLANNLGNLVNRVLSMIKRYEVKLTDGLDNELHVELKKSLDAYHEHWQRFEIHLACEDLRELLVLANQYVDQKKPWELAKTDQSALTEVLYSLYQILVAVSVMLAPIMPETASKLQQRLGLEEIKNFQEAAERLPTKELDIGDALFPRLES